MIDNFEYFQVSQKALLIRANKILIVELADRINTWDLPGGRLDKGEYSEPAFQREIKEELGFESFKNLGVIEYDIWYLKREKIPVCGIVNLIKNDNDEIKLSDEHINYKWITEDEIDDYKYIWKKMDSMLKRGFEYKKLLQNNEQ